VGEPEIAGAVVDVDGVTEGHVDGHSPVLLPLPLPVKPLVAVSCTW